jgi:hypothetical protein
VLVKCIDNKSVFGDKEKILETVMSDKTREHLLYRVFGEITGSQTGLGKHKRINKETGLAEDTFWTKFMGDFRAISAETGEMFTAATAFLPAYVSGQFVTALKDDEEGLSIIFAYDIYARYNKDSITSYEFIAVKVRKQDETNAVQAMAEALPPMPNRKALPAPQKDGKQKPS